MDPFGRRRSCGISRRAGRIAPGAQADPSGCEFDLIWLSSLAPLGLLINPRRAYRRSSRSFVWSTPSRNLVLLLLPSFWRTFFRESSQRPRPAGRGGRDVAMLVNLGIGPLVERVGYAPSSYSPQYTSDRCSRAMALFQALTKEPLLLISHVHPADIDTRDTAFGAASRQHRNLWESHS